MYFDKYLWFAGYCERNFEVGRRSRVGALEITILFWEDRNYNKNLILPNFCCTFF